MPMPEAPDQTDADAPTSTLIFQNKNTSLNSHHFWLLYELEILDISLVLL